MHSSKLLTLLRGLRPEEIHWFQKFLNSPFHNNNTLPIHLFNLIKKYYPDFNSPKLNKEKVFQKLFPNEKFKVQKLRKVMHELANLTEAFFVTMRLRNNNFQRKKILVQELGERNLYAHFEKGTKNLIRELNALPYRDTFFYKDIFELNLNYSNHPETNRQLLNPKLLKIESEHLDYFYLLQQQQLDFTLKFHKKIFKENVSINSLKQTQIALQQEPLFKIYQLINKAVSSPDNDDNYLKIETLFKEEIEKLGKTDKDIILRVLINYYSSQINKGKAEYFSHVFSLYKFGLGNNILVDNNLMRSSTFSNIITVGANQKAYDWVEDFIENHKKYLAASTRDDTYFFGLGLLFFHKKEFSKTIDLISNHKFSKQLQNLQSKTILLRAYFEQYLLDNSYYELLIAQTQAFEKFIRRNELISESKKERYLNFTLFMRRIVNGHWQGKLDRSLLELLKNADAVLLKFYLLKKLEEIIE